MNKHFFYIFFRLAILAGLGAACTGSPITATPTTAEQAVLPSATSLPSTDTPEPTATTTPEPTATPLPTDTLESVATSVQVVTPTQAVDPDQIINQRLTDADAVVQAGNYEHAIQLYTELIESYPENNAISWAYSFRADAYVQLHDYDSAIADYKTLVELEADDANNLNNICWYMGITGQAEAALPYCEKGVELNSRPYVRDSRGLTYAQLGRFAEAMADFQTLVDELEGETDPEQVSTHAERLAWVKVLKNGQNPITPEVLAQLRGDKDRQPAIIPPATGTGAVDFNNQGEDYVESDNPETAISYFNQAIQLDPAYADAYLNRGLVYVELGYPAAAILDFDKAIELEPENEEAYSSRSLCYKQLGYFKEAIQDSSKAIDLDPDLQAAYLIRGSAYAYIGEMDLAISDLNRSIELDPGDKLAYYNRGEAFYLLKNFEAAITDFTKAIEIDPSFTDAVFYRGIVYAVLDKPDKAKTDLEKAMRLGLSPEQEQAISDYLVEISNPLLQSTPEEQAEPEPLPTPVPIAKISTELPKTIQDEHGTTMVLVPGGPFTMGMDAKEANQRCQAISGKESCSLDYFSDAEPAHTVVLDDFYMDLTEVTNGMYTQCVKAGVCSPPRGLESYTHADYTTNPAYDDYPVIWVSWKYAQTYCEWRGARLPTEAEWEKAARGTDGRLYPWGDVFYSGYANYCDGKCRLRGYNDPLPVGSFPFAGSFYGVLDMAGNVAEWVHDVYDENYYAISPQHNPLGPEDGSGGYGIRGGTYLWPAPGLFTILRNTPVSNSADAIGFRCARTP